MTRRALLATGAATAALAATGGQASAASPAPTDRALAESLPGDFRSGYAEANGTRLHYVSGGEGSPLVLLPGWPQTWWQFRKIMPALGERHRVIAVDLRGMGGSAKPAAGYDKKTMATDIVDLARTLGYDRVDVAGHDIGAMVAFSMAANHPGSVGKLSLLDVTHPDEGLYQLTLLPRPGQSFYLWWFAFNQVTGLPEQLLTGRSRPLIDWLYGYMLHNPGAVDESARTVYAQAYSTPDAIRGGNGWYQAFGQDIIDSKTYSKLTLPSLVLASATNHDYLADTVSRQCANYRLVTIDNTGHYLTEEQPEAVVAELTAFFG